MLTMSCGKRRSLSPIPNPEDAPDPSLSPTAITDESDIVMVNAESADNTPISADPDPDSNPNPAKKRKIERLSQRPRLHFTSTVSQSAKYSYQLTFAKERPQLILPDDLVGVLLSYCHIYDLYQLREDEFFRDIMEKKIKSNPNYLHEIFVVDTGITNCRLLCRYDPRWSLMLLPRLGVPAVSELPFKRYAHECIGSHYVDDMDENSVDAAILASLSMEHQVVPHDTLLRIIRKIFVDDKTTHTLVQHLRGLGLRELEMYHKPFLLGLN